MPPTRRLRYAAASLLATALAGAWLVMGPFHGEPGVSPAEPVPAGLVLLERPADQPLRPPPKLGPDSAPLVVFFVDGLGAAPFHDLLAAGQLPSTRRLIESRPTWVGQARGSFPTSTAPNVPELLTGSWSHRLGGMPDSIHALDREKLRLVRYEVERAGWDGLSQTLFDRVQGAGGTSLSYFEGYFPGASVNVHDELVYLLDTARAARRHDLVVQYDDRSMGDLTRRLRAAEEAPNLIFLRLGAVDTAGHFYGPDSETYREAIVATDRHLGELLDLLEQSQLSDGSTLLDAATLVLVADHGMATTTTHLDLDAVLRGVGLSPWPTSTPTDVLASELDTQALADHGVVAVPNGSNLASIYLRDRGPSAALPWSKAPSLAASRTWPVPGRPPVDLVQTLLDQPGVARVSTHDGSNTYSVYGGQGALHIERRFQADGGWSLAASADGNDPFGFCADPAMPCCPRDRLVAACFQSPAQWRELTRKGAWPELPLMVVKAFSGPVQRQPDLLVEAAPGVGFMAQTRGDHGRFGADLDRVPLVISGPRVDPAAAVDDPRLIDLLPTLMPLLGLGAPLGVDGEALPVLR